MKLLEQVYVDPQDAAVTVAEEAISITLQPAGAIGPMGPQGPAATITTDTLTYTTASIEAGAIENNAVALGKTTLLSRIVTTQPARIRLYATSALRDADVARPIGTLPSGNHGLLF